MPWVATADAEYALRRTSDCAVLVHRLNEVVAARWLEAAVPAQHRADEQLIEPDTGNQQQARQTNDPFHQYQAYRKVLWEMRP